MLTCTRRWWTLTLTTQPPGLTSRLCSLGWTPPSSSTSWPTPTPRWLGTWNSWSWPVETKCNSRQHISSVYQILTSDQQLLLKKVDISEQGNLNIMSQSCPHSDISLSSFVLISYLKLILWIKFPGKTFLNTFIAMRGIKLKCWRRSVPSLGLVLCFYLSKQMLQDSLSAPSRH